MGAVDTAEAPVVQAMFAAYVDERLGATALANRLNDTGQRNRNDRLWSNQTVLRVLRNPVYIGKISHGDDLYDGKHNPVIHPDVFANDQLLAERAAESATLAPTLSEYLLSGKLRCRAWAAPTSARAPTAGTASTATTCAGPAKPKAPAPAPAGASPPTTSKPPSSANCPYFYVPDMGKPGPLLARACRTPVRMGSHQVEVAGIEPASFSTSPGLLRVQPASFFSAPAVVQASRRTGSAAVCCPV
jgi:hypothetical protein